MAKRHQFRTTLAWDAATGGSNTSYTSYSRNHVLSFPGKPDLAASSHPAFRGDPARHDPEDLLVASLSSCHFLWYIHLCAQAGILIERYSDEAEGTMIEDAKTGGRFERVVLRPRVRISKGDPAKAAELHHEAHRLCFVANSVNFPVDCEPVIELATA
jgi:organic hydroperoxide reductase OsmC/OhrA